MDATFPYLEAVVGFSVVVFVLHTYLDFRQLRAIRIPKPPKYVADQYTPDAYREKQAYNEDKWWFGLVHGGFDTALNLAMLLGGYMPAMWDMSRRLALRVGLPGGEISSGIAYFFIDSGLHLLLGLPWSVYSSFVVEQRHGFNKQTIGTFVTDIIKQVLLAAVIAPPLLAGFVWLLGSTGPYVALYLWAFVLSISLFFMTIYPVAIAPLFNKFDPLPEGELREGVESLAASLEFPLTKLYVVDGSRRSAHSNAYMYGFFKNKRIVLYDTLVEQCTNEEVVAVLAHELGHWKLRHTPVLFIVSQLVLLAQLGLFTVVRTAPGLFESFGFAPGVRPLYLSFSLFQLIVSPLDEVIGFLSHMVSRAFEFQADGFAVGLDHAAKLKDALLVLDKENKSTLNVDPLYSAYHYSHPPLVERLKAIDALALEHASSAAKAKKDK